MVNTVEVLRVRLLLPLHKFRPRRSGTFQQQVNVIRHQTIRINHDSVSLPIVRKPFQVDLIVLFLEKGFLSLVSPYNNVIKNTRSKLGFRAMEFQLSGVTNLCQLIHA